MSKYYNGELPCLNTDEAKEFFDTYSEVSPHCTNHKGMEGPGPFFETLYQAFKTRLLDEGFVAKGTDDND